MFDLNLHLICHFQLVHLITSILHGEKFHISKLCQIWFFCLDDFCLHQPQHYIKHQYSTSIQFLQTHDLCEYIYIISHYIWHIVTLLINIGCNRDISLLPIQSKYYGLKIKKQKKDENCLYSTQIFTLINKNHKAT